MNATSKRKWYASLILAGILLLLAMVGGKWGTTYAADINAELTPVITSIVPFEIRAGYPTDVTMIVYGYNFEDQYSSLAHTNVRLTGGGHDIILDSIQKLSTAISVRISPSLLDHPVIYNITVVKSSNYTIPTIPIVPPVDLVSNPVPFNVYVLQPKYIPVIYK